MLSNVPTPTRIPFYIEESLRRRSEQQPDSSAEHSKYPSEEELRSWIAASSFNWVMRNHLIDHLQTTLSLASNPEQQEVLEQLLKNCKVWNQAEISATRSVLKPLTKDNLNSYRVWELKELARQLRDRGIKDPADPQRIQWLASYTGAGALKHDAVEGIWNALNHAGDHVDPVSPNARGARAAAFMNQIADGCPSPSSVCSTELRITEGEAIQEPELAALLDGPFSGLLRDNTVDPNSILVWDQQRQPQIQAVPILELLGAYPFGTGQQSVWSEQLLATMLQQKRDLLRSSLVAREIADEREDATPTFGTVVLIINANQEQQHRWVEVHFKWHAR
jgi:hypothetical protein